MIRAGDKLFGCSGSNVFAIERASTEPTPRVIWKTTIDGTAARLLAADDRLFVVTTEGSIYCFGANQADSVVHSAERYGADDRFGGREAAQRPCSERLNTQGGYSVVWGVGDGSLVLALLQSERFECRRRRPRRRQGERAADEVSRRRAVWSPRDGARRHARLAGVAALFRFVDDHVKISPPPASSWSRRRSQQALRLTASVRRRVPCFISTKPIMPNLPPPCAMRTCRRPSSPLEGRRHDARQIRSSRGQRRLDP